MSANEWSVDIQQQLDISVPIDKVFEGVLLQFSEKMKYPDGRSMNFKLEARPGGRWYRDLGNDSGHLWGHVQVIKAPNILEISGPMFMSYPVLNHFEVRLSEHEGKTRLNFRHRAVGPVDEQTRTGVSGGWKEMLDELKRDSEA
ncbi:MAG: SRPBCC domain-containing protein [Candidatus Hydrogenedentes bacterium]|nr:SRPBCC domain-containing protein [Candidatus Hydrogenedentota bacterium]